MEINKQRLITAIEDINNREIFEEVLPVTYTKPRLINLLGEVAKNLTEYDEIDKETGELLLDLKYELPRKLHTYTRKNEPVQEVTINFANDEYVLLPVNWIWFWNDKKWELIEAYGLTIPKYPTVLFFYIENDNSYSFYEKIGSSLIYQSMSKDLDEAIKEFVYHTAKLKSLPDFVFKMMMKNLKRRNPNYYPIKERKVFIKTKDEKGYIVWKMEQGKLIRSRGKWQEFIFYRVKNTENISKVGEYLILEALSGVALFAGGNKVGIEMDFYDYMATQNPDEMKKRLSKAIKEDGASPFYPGIYQWTTLDKQRKRVKPEKRTKKIGKAISDIMIQNPEIIPKEVMTKLQEQGFSSLSLSNIETYVYRQRKLIRKLMEGN